MLPKSESQKKSECSRREFIKRSTVASATAFGTLALARSSHAAGSDVIKFGLIGCGGRGSGAAANAMNAGKDVRMFAMADLFAEHLQNSRERLKEMYPEQTIVDDEHCFVGLDAYEKLIQSGVDVVLIAIPPYFHPLYLKTAIDADKHVFCEKPHGVDVPGMKLSMLAAEEAKKKNLCVVSGLCWRSDPGVRETMKRIHDGAIGDIVAIQENYLGTPYGLRERRPEWTEMEYQFRNWYHFSWLSGDQTGQQLVHSLDKSSWAMGDVPPVKAWGMGGRQVMVDSKYGDQFDHHAVVYEYANGARLFGFTRDMLGCYNEVTDTILGTKGRALLPIKPRIEGEKPWRYKGPNANMYDVEHKEMFAAIRAGKTINNGNYMCTSTMLAILAQLVCYTGQEITWEQAMNSKLVLGPTRCVWDAEPSVKPGPNGQYPASLPGITKFR